MHARESCQCTMIHSWKRGCHVTMIHPWKRGFHHDSICHLVEHVMELTNSLCCDLQFIHELGMGGQKEKWWCSWDGMALSWFHTVRCSLFYCLHYLTILEIALLFSASCNLVAIVASFQLSNIIVQFHGFYQFICHCCWVSVVQNLCKDLQHFHRPSLFPKETLNLQLPC